MFKLLLPLLLLNDMTPINICCFVVNKLFYNNNEIRASSHGYGYYYVMIRII